MPRSTRRLSRCAPSQKLYDRRLGGFSKPGTPFIPGAERQVADRRTARAVPRGTTAPLVLVFERRQDAHGRAGGNPRITEHSQWRRGTLAGAELERFRVYGQRSAPDNGTRQTA